MDPTVAAPRSPLPEVEHAFARVADTEIALVLPEVDSAAERARLGKELSEAAAHADRLTKQLTNPKFREKAPAHVVEGMETTLTETRHKVAGLQERLRELD